MHRPRKPWARPSILFATGRLRGHGPRLSKLPTEPAELAAELRIKRELTLPGIAQLMGEALVPDGLREALYQVAAGLPGAKVRGDLER